MKLPASGQRGIKASFGRPKGLFRSSTCLSTSTARPLYIRPNVLPFDKLRTGRDSLLAMDDGLWRVDKGEFRHRVTDHIKRRREK